MMTTRTRIQPLNSLKGLRSLRDSWRRPFNKASRWGPNPERKQPMRIWQNRSLKNRLQSQNRSQLGQSPGPQNPPVGHCPQTVRWRFHLRKSSQSKQQSPSLKTSPLQSSTSKSRLCLTKSGSLRMPWPMPRGWSLPRNPILKPSRELLRGLMSPQASSSRSLKSWRSKSAKSRMPTSSQY